MVEVWSTDAGWNAQRLDVKFLSILESRFFDPSEEGKGSSSRMVKALIAAVWKAEIYCQANVKLWGPPIRSLGRLRSLKKNTEAV